MAEHFGFPLETILVFAGLVVGAVILDLFAHRSSKEISIRDASIWSVFWVVLSLGFYGYLNVHHSREFGSLFLSGYILEKSLSVDNLVVFIAIFTNFNIQGPLQHRILYYGIIGAVVFRLIFVAFGTGLFGLSNWIEFAFAAVVAWTAWKMLRAGEGDDEMVDYSTHWSVTMTKKLFPVFPRLVGKQFFVSHTEVERLAASDSSIEKLAKAGMAVTPAFLCLVCIEVSDVIFAFDSVPAVVAVTQEPLLVYSAVIFAVLGLRSMYFVLAAAQRYLAYLEKAVIVLLFFIAGKLALQASRKVGWTDFHLDHTISLGIILGVLAIGVVASLLFPPKEDAETKPEP